ncbi:MAG: hypothetical protein WA703_08595, partial [Pseudolabrys sp.]
ICGSARGFTNVRGGLPARPSIMVSSHNCKSQMITKQHRGVQHLVLDVNKAAVLFLQTPVSH